MEAAVQKIISEFEANPMVCSRTLRSIYEQDQAGFFESLLPLLRRGEGSSGFQYLLTFLLSEGILLKPLCDPEVFTLDEAIAIARRVRQVDSQFDVRLLRSMVHNNGSTSNQELERIASSAAGIRLLDIMNEVSDGTHVLTTMTQLMSHPDARVRSKAALLVGRSNKNHKWVQGRMGESDARVRANAVESLWGADNAGSRAVFWSALGDENCRVVGNAVLGLYRLGDPSSIRLVQQLLSHPDTAFRVSGVWVMGETGDPRFLPMLARLIGEPVAELRGHAFRAMAKLKKAMAQRTACEPLTVIAGPPRRLENNWNQFSAAIRYESRQQIPELNVTNFAVWEDSTLVREYSIRQRGKSEPLAVAMAFPRILDRGGPAVDIQDDGIERALRHKRKHDFWMVMKYITASQEKPRPPAVAAPQPSNSTSILRLETAALVLNASDVDLSAVRMRFTTNANALIDAVSSPGTRLACANDLHQATRALIDAARQMRAFRNVILVCQSPVDTFTGDVKDQILDANTSGVAVHIISPWPTAAMNEFCSRTGGTLLTPQSPDQIPKTLEGLCASLLNSYEVRYQPENPGASKLRLQIYTGTLMGEAVQNL
jgi:hypothetical protein